MLYKTIFNINLQHAYFLDEGNVKFSPILGEAAMTNNQKKEVLKNYTILDYLKLIPIQNTNTLIKNHRLLLKTHSQGFRLLTSVLEKNVLGEMKHSPLIQLEEDTVLTFAMYATDSNFYNYTNIVDTIEDRLYLFSNVVNSLESPITNIFTGDGTIDANYLLSVNDSKKILQTIINEEDTIGNTPKQFSLANKIALINADDLLTTVEKTVQIDAIITAYIKAQKRNGLIGFIRLKVEGEANTNLFEFINDRQYIIDSTLAFTLRFKNRNTFWRYIHTTDEITLTTEKKNPLTKNGFIEIEATHFTPQPTENYQYPNPTATLVKEENNNYYSEIFI